MREKWKRLRMGAAVTCICMFVLGIVLVIWPGISVLGQPTVLLCKA